MIGPQIHRLPGMRDLTGDALVRVSQAMDTLRAYLSASGYAAIDTPLLEETDLFARKSGGELTSRLYNFTDPGGREVSLRPEFTSSVIRHFVQEWEHLDTPVRWHYQGPVFRYERGERTEYRQYTQVGAEVIGVAGVEADADLLYLAWHGLERLGMRAQRLRIGHLGVVNGLLSAFGLPQPAKLFVVAHLNALKSGSLNVSDLIDRAEDAGIIGGGSTVREATSLGDVSAESARGFVKEVLRESMPAPVGRRTTDQIVNRLLRKRGDAVDTDKFERALSLVSRLAPLDGPAEVLLTEARHIVTSGTSGESALGELDALVEALKSRNLSNGRVTLDLGMARGISYYTGVIFELTHPTPAAEVSLGGGGRYDGLVRAMGASADVPALGFAYNLNQVVDVLYTVNPAVSKDPADS